jgi:O-antigen/teichoic acid export membrane protein
MLARNLVSNFIGQAWTALMGLAFIPLYIQYLGIESYGLIGIFGILVAWLSLLDMGLAPALSREMARFTGGQHSPESIRDLLRSVEFVTIGMALVVACLMAIGSRWIAEYWVRTEQLPVGTVTEAFAIMGLVTALRFVEAVYRSSIVGLQKQVLFNLLNSLMATFRSVGAFAIVAWVSPTIQAFFMWQVLASILTLLMLAFATYSELPKTIRGAKFSLAALRSVWHFAGGMLGITFLSLLLMQTDKMLLSRLLNLADFGYYTLAATISGALYVLIQPILQAWFPRLNQLRAENNQGGLIESYHLGAQFVTVVAGSAALVLMVGGEPILQLWTQDKALANRVAPLLAVLTLGNFLNCLMWIPYQTQLAHGWTGLALRINIIAVLIIVPALFWIAPRYGAEGAVWVWAILNAGYVIVGVQFMYCRILTTEKLRWYVDDILRPLLPAFLIALVFRWILDQEMSQFSQVAIIILFCASTLLISTIFAKKLCKNAIYILSKNYIKFNNTQ